MMGNKTVPMLTKTRLIPLQIKIIYTNIVLVLNSQYLCNHISLISVYVVLNGEGDLAGCGLHHGYSFKTCFCYSLVEGRLNQEFGEA